MIDYLFIFTAVFGFAILVILANKNAVPNSLSLAILAGFIPAKLYLGETFSQMTPHFIAFGIGVVVLLLLFAFVMQSGGFIKMMMCITLWTPYEFIATIVIGIIVINFVVTAILIAVSNRDTAQKFTNFYTITALVIAIAVMHSGFRVF